MGTYSEEVPGDMALIFVRNSDKNIIQEEDESFNTVFKCGNFNTFADAEKIRLHFVNEGVSDAKVVAFYGLEPVTLEEARKMTNE